MRYWTQLACEQFPPSDLVRQAVEAERTGFDALCVSDHFQPWWEPGESAQAWVPLGGIGCATERVALDTGVTAPVHRYHPAVVDAGGPADRTGGRRGLPRGVRGRRSRAGRDHPAGRRLVGRQRRGRIRRRAVWKGAQPDEYYTDDWSEPRAMARHAEQEISDDALRAAYIVSSAPDEHADRIREVERMGATVVCIQNASGVDPHAALEVYGERVLPALRGRSAPNVR